MTSPLRALVIVALSLALGLGCSKAEPFEGLMAAQAGTGPAVKFDLLHTPLPEIPFPNDLATRPDPSSPTGLRVNASLVAPTQLERNLRGLLDRLDGFGTFAPITVSFDGDLDFDDLYAKQNDGDPTNDGIYLVDLTTGAPVQLDLNGGHYPISLKKSDQYFLNDPLSNVSNLLFPITGPFANFLHPDDARFQADPAHAADDLLTFYERSTRTLIVRPVLPLQPERRYAVLLTNRLLGANGQPVRSPFSGINHAAQTDELLPVLSMLPAGVSASDVTFAWAFTTQSTTRDLEAIQAGLHGQGLLRFLSGSFPVGLLTSQANGTSGFGSLLRVYPLTDNPPAGQGPHILTGAKLREVVSDPSLSQILGFTPAQLQALLDSLQYIDYFVGGTFPSLNFLSDRDRSPFDSTFHVDPKAGTAFAAPSNIPFFLAVPKQTPGHLPPFPVAILGHGYKSSRFEGMVGFAGTFAKFGVASVAIDAYGHGLEGAATPLEVGLATALLQNKGLGGFAALLFLGRARDLDNDGIPDSGGDFWTADAFHTRDVVRQSVVDWMQLVRVLRSFDGFSQMSLPDSSIQLAGDFNGDGIPDVGGPAVFTSDINTKGTNQLVYPAGAPDPGNPTFIFGQSLGGILCSLLPAVEPAITAGACGSTAGGLSDVLLRSTEPNVVKAALLELLGPIIATCGYDPATGTCGSGPQTLVFDVENVNKEAILPIAPVALAPGDRVTLLNLTQTSADTSCAAAPVPGCKTVIADASGQLRASLGADWPNVITQRTSQGNGLPDLVKVTVVRPGDSLLVRIEPASGAAARTVSTWESGAYFQGITYAPGAPLTAPARGFGYDRNTPELRRLFGLSQMMLGAGDPINYAPHYFKDPLPARNGVPANVLVMLTTGDTTVPIAAGLSLARAAGLVETKVPDPDYGIPIDQVLIKSGATEGLPGLLRYADPTYGPRAALGAHVRCDGAGCGQPVLLDPSGFSCDATGGNCTDGFDVPRLNPPLRTQLQVQTSAGTSALILEYISPQGSHSFLNPQPQKPFDADLFFANLVGRYFQTGGTEVNYDPCQQFTATCPWIPPIPP